MDRVIYTKYNSLRKPEYRLTTEIHDGDRGKWVEKRAAGPAAEAQLDRIMASRELALRLYRNIRVIDAKREEGRIVFPFVSGRSLADRIDTDVLDRDRFVRQVNELFSLVLDAKEECACPFEPTEDFKAVFGNEYPKNARALCPANIDSIFSNFIETGDGLVCLDYEWVCDFPVPVDYIKYRILLYLHNEWVNSVLDGVSRDTFMDWFGLSETDCGIYWNMEMSFQQLIHGTAWRYRHLEQYKKKQLYLSGILSENAVQKQAIHDKDVHIASMEQVVRDKDVHIASMEQVVRDKDEYIAGMEQVSHDQHELINRKNEHIAAIEKAIHDKDVHIANLQQQYNEISGAFFWRITKPARNIVIFTRQMLQKNDKVYLLFRCLKAGLRHGPKRMAEVWRSARQENGQKKRLAAWPTKKEIKEQKQSTFDRKIKFSILVPLYNTPPQFLKEMIQSVRSQTYGNWELCLADGSDSEHSNVQKICKSLARRDGRIKYKKLCKNQGISGNTNACIEMATGEYIALFDHDDILHPSALFEVMKAICEKGADYIYTDEATFQSPDLGHIITFHFKPDFAPDNLLANNYICHFSAFSRNLLDKAGVFRHEYDGSQDHDLILRLTYMAEHVVHIPKLLYYWRSHPLSVAQDIGAKQYAVDAAKNAVKDFLRDYKQEDVEVKSTRAFPTIFQIIYPLKKREKVSIIIPNKDHIEDLKRCVESILTRSTYDNFEIIIVENNSETEEIEQYYNEIRSNKKIRIIKYEGDFNYSRINNYAVHQSDGEYVLLLNNDTEIITPDWIENMMMYAQREDIGAVGAKLYFPDGRIQHAGVTLKLGADRVAGHTHYGVDHDNLGYMGRLCYAQDVSAVTAACMMLRRTVFDEVNGLDEELAVAFNDVDFCLRIRKKGYLIIFTPFAELYHYESASRGLETGERRDRFLKEGQLFKDRWKDVLEAGDPYYNPNFSLDSSTFDVRIKQ